MASLHMLDYYVLVLYFVAIVGISIYTSRQVKNLHDFATGGAAYGTFFIFASLSSSFIGGGFTMGLAEKTFSVGLLYVIALWGFSLKEVLVARYIAPRMDRFKGAISVGEIMGRLYGNNVRIFTGFASVLVCGGIAGAQFGAFGYITHVLLGVPKEVGAVIGAMLIILYATYGGMKSVVANDVLHFCVLIISLPILYFLAADRVGGFSSLIMTSQYYNTSTISHIAIASLFLSFFFGETLVPPYVQRLLIGKSVQHTAKGTLLSGIISVPFFLMIGLIGVAAHQLNPTVNANVAMPYVISTVMPIGLKGFVIAGLLAVIMSSADSFLNAAAIAVSHDFIKPMVGKIALEQELLISRVATVIVGIIGVTFAISIESVLEILLQAYNFWTPIILVPLVAGILGYRRSTSVFWLSALCGISTVVLLKLLALDLLEIDPCIFGIMASATVFFGLGQYKQSSSAAVEEVLQ